MNRRWWVIFCTAVLAVVAAQSVDAAPTTLPAQMARPNDSVGQDGCLRDDCHASLRKYAIVHGPVGVNACDACHELTDARSHTFRLTREKAELCTYCHELDLSASPVVHKPAKEGQCIGCHDPHGGTTKALLRESSIRATCNRCHEDITHDRTFLHAPVAEGACDSCHPPHASRFPKLLDRAGPDLCLACHEGFDASLANAKFIHKALEKGCEKCHDPHGSKFAMSTTQPVVQQCAGCHEKVTAEAAAARYPHTPVLNDRACVTCHTPHGGSLARLVSDAPETLCMSCHAKQQKAAGGRTVGAVAELMSPRIKHGGIKDGSCAGCHAAHGGSRELFLSKNYSFLFYQRFAPATYELCFGCHDARLVTETTTSKITAFRNGERNLHSLHVRDTRERGENCRVCHPAHAAGNERLVRDAVTYGAWRMPVRFTKTPTGGACYPGCHPRYGYDRDRPVMNTPGKAAPPPTSMPIAHERPARIVLDARDVTGAAVAIPAGDRPTVIALIRADQTAQARRALTLLEDALKDRPDGRVIVVRTGVAGVSPATAPASLLPDWFTVSDADGSLAAGLDVRGWPTVLVITASGLEIARLSGSAESIAVKLPAYLDLAAGRPGAEQKKVAVHDVVGKEGDWKNARDVRRVEMLITSGKGEDALKLLKNLPEGSIPHWQYNLFGARALATLNRWPEAKVAAEAALAENPDLPAAHYLLGQFYERAQDWPRAAAQYRAATARPGR